MSGTSLDAIDAVLVDFGMVPLKIIATHSEPIPDHLKQILIKLCDPQCESITQMGEADVALGRLFAKSVQELLKKSSFPAKNIRAIGSHGQTIRHAPDTKTPFTLQIGDPNTIAAETGITTVADFRRRDMALGGQAAPLAPAFHNFLLRDDREHRWIVNIGGIANVTYLSARKNQPVIGFDTGPGNTLLDTWCSRHLKKAYDHGGKWAARGTSNSKLLEMLLEDPYFQRKPPKSTGREYFNLYWLDEKLKRLKLKIPEQDVQSTLLDLTAHSIAHSIKNFSVPAGSIWLCGGGTHNAELVKRLKERCNPFRVTTTEEVGVHPDWVEAVCFAWLAKQTLENKPGNLPSVTGAKKASVLGAIYPHCNT